MFYYCAKCGNIKKVTLKGNEGVSCEVCGTPMQPVPAEYLMPNGNFFKSQDVRQNFISAIQSSDTYDPEIGGKKEEVKREIEEEKQQRIQEMNQTDLPEPQWTLPQQRSAGGEHLHQSHPRPPGAGGAEKGGNGGDPGGLGRRLPPDGRPRNPFSPAGSGGGEYPLCGLRVAQRRH